MKSLISIALSSQGQRQESMTSRSREDSVEESPKSPIILGRLEAGNRTQINLGLVY
jgi:hypothetical protein